MTRVRLAQVPLSSSCTGTCPLLPLSSLFELWLCVPLCRALVQCGTWIVSARSISSVKASICWPQRVKHLQSYLQRPNVHTELRVSTSLGPLLCQTWLCPQELWCFELVCYFTGRNINKQGSSCNIPRDRCRRSSALVSLWHQTGSPLLR